MKRLRIYLGSMLIRKKYSDLTLDLSNEYFKEVTTTY